MAQKRMFDKAIVDLDRFMDLPLSSKALYFLLGIEADDEGFVSPRKVMRIHGGTEDDIKLLIAKGFLISFPSGVVVVTDWYTNNYLDKNRVKATEYTEEREQLRVSLGNKYMLNDGLTSGQPEEKRGEENIGVYEIVKDEEKPRTVVKPKYEQIFKLFGKYPLNWKTNKTQIQAAENLLEEHGLVQVRKALEFHSEMKEEPYCPQILTPWDLDTKWKKLIAFKKKHGD